MKLRTLAEGALQVVHDFPLLRRHPIGIAPVDGRKFHGVHRVLRAVYRDRPLFRIYLVEQESVLHLELRMAAYQFALGLKHHHVNGLHHGLRRGSLVVLLGKKLEATQGDTVAALQDADVVVAHIVSHHVRDAGLIARSRAHPEHIVVAPLDVERVVVHEQLYDFIGIRTAVKEIADNVQVIHREPFNERRERNDEFVAVLDADNRVEYALMVGKLIAVLVRQSVQKLVYDVAELARHGLSHLGTRVLRREQTSYLYHLPQYLAIPLRRNFSLAVQASQFLFRIIDEGSQISLLGIA